MEFALEDIASSLESLSKREFTKKWVLEYLEEMSRGKEEYLEDVLEIERERESERRELEALEEQDSYRSGDEDEDQEGEEEEEPDDNYVGDEESEFGEDSNEGKITMNKIDRYSLGEICDTDDPTIFDAAVRGRLLTDGMSERSQDKKVRNFWKNFTRSTVGTKLDYPEFVVFLEAYLLSTTAKKIQAPVPLFSPVVPVLAPPAPPVSTTVGGAPFAPAANQRAAGVGRSAQSASQSSLTAAGTSLLTPQPATLEEKNWKKWVSLVAMLQKEDLLPEMVRGLRQLAGKLSGGRFQGHDNQNADAEVLWKSFKALTRYLHNSGAFEPAFECLSLLTPQSQPPHVGGLNRPPFPHLGRSPQSPFPGSQPPYQGPHPPMSLQQPPLVAGSSYAQPGQSQQSHRPWQQPPPVGGLNRQLSHPGQSNQPPFLSNRQPSQRLDPQFSPADTYRVHDQAGPISSRMNAIEFQLAAICAAMGVFTGGTGVYQ